MTRRQLMLGMPAFLQNRPQRVIVLMVDGLGADYIAASAMPVWLPAKEGIGKIVNRSCPPSRMPTTPASAAAPGRRNRHHRQLLFG